jgi:hypothetical protein
MLQGEELFTPKAEWYDLGSNGVSMSWSRSTVARNRPFLRCALALPCPKCSPNCRL